MTERRAVFHEAHPGVVHISTELLDELVTRLGWRKVEPENGGDREYVHRGGHPAPRAARPPHPDTMAGK